MGQGITSTQFYLFGKKSFTSTGYQKHIKSYSSPVQSKASIALGATGADGTDLTGKVIVVTGANSGLGKELATYAAAKGANVYMICRNKERAEKAKESIINETSNNNVNVLLADVGEMAQVEKVTKELQSKEEKVDCLVCNAGVLLNEKRLTSEGNEVTFASHFLGGSYLLSSLLYPQLKATEDSRVIFVSSGGMYNSKFPSWKVATNEEQKYDGQMAYVYAKRGQVLLAERWAETYPETCWVSAHPGWTNTPAVDDAYGKNKKYLEPMRTTWEGAEGIAWLMSTEKKNIESGAFYLDRESQRKHISGPFMSDGTFTKNSAKEVDEMLANLKKLAGAGL